MPEPTPDTWGVSGPSFLGAYLGALIIFVLLALLFRRNALRGSEQSPHGLPGPDEVAMMNGGPKRAILAAVAGLRAAGAIDVGPKATLTTNGAAPEGLTRLGSAVFHAAAQGGVTTASLERDPRIQSTLAEVWATIERSGWTLDAAARYRARLGAFLVLGLAIFGGARTAAGITNDKPWILIALLTVAALVIGLVLFMRLPARSSAGQAALNEVHKRNVHLAPHHSPSWATYGVVGGSMGVALFGTGALWAADPAFAGEAGINRESLAGSGSASYGGGGSGCSGGGGGGDGGGGGGGCGGGCGG